MRPSAFGYIVVPQGGPSVAFVPDPDCQGRWVKVDASVLLIKCPFCDAPIGYPCRGVAGKPTSSSHWMRRKEAGAQSKARMKCASCGASSYRMAHCSMKVSLSGEAVQLQRRRPEGENAIQRIKNAARDILRELGEVETKEKA